jgi:predicted dehydrogenase
MGRACDSMLRRFTGENQEFERCMHNLASVLFHVPGISGGKTMQAFGVGMVGYGFMGKVHTYAYQSLPMMYDPAPAKIRLVGVATASEASGRKAIDQAGYEFATRDYRDLLASDDIHLINVCVPNNLHRDVVIDAIGAGKHVYCDKPLALNLAEAEEM